MESTSTPSFDIQPILENEKVALVPLKPADFEDLYQIAADPLVWEQHPNKNRWQLEVFKTFFEGAIQSKGAFKIVDKVSGNLAGCTRVYGFSKAKDQILIGYTFFGRAYWGTGLNHASKALLLEYLFQYVSMVLFHIGAQNTRSQISIGRLGAQKIGEEEVAYFGEPVKLNFVYKITKDAWWESRK